MDKISYFLGSNLLERAKCILAKFQLNKLSYIRAGARYMLLEGPWLMDLENFGGPVRGPVVVFGNIGGAMAPLAPPVKPAMHYQCTLKKLLAPKVFSHKLRK